jgi:hypothetical protein
MWRPAHGATSRPGPSRPANGYGREVSRPGPRPHPPGIDEPTGALDPMVFGDLAPLVWAVELDQSDVEAPAPVTP